MVRGLAVIRGVDTRRAAAFLFAIECSLSEGSDRWNAKRRAAAPSADRRAVQDGYHTRPCTNTAR
jgi:hypothetical protein